MLYTCCVDMAANTTSCQCRQNQATFAACTLPIAGDFEYIFRPSVIQPGALCIIGLHMMQSTADV